MESMGGCFHINLHSQTISTHHFASPFPLAAKKDLNDVDTSRNCFALKMVPNRLLSQLCGAEIFLESFDLQANHFQNHCAIPNGIVFFLLYSAYIINGSSILLSFHK